MQTITDKKITTQEIPLAGTILRGDWGSPTYLIITELDTKEGHKQTVNAEVDRLQREFSEKNHGSVSLREVKRELVFKEERYWMQYGTLVQFRVRDSY